MKPIIGIVSRPGIIFDKYNVQVTEETYKNAILELGGIPITILPPQNISFNDIAPRETPRLTTEEKEDLNRLLMLCDALVMPGGFKTYEYDYYICNYARLNNVPILGICAGMQVMSREGSNFTLEKNTSDMHKSIEQYAHKIKISKDSILYDIIKKEQIMVNSAHSYHTPSGGINNVSAISLEDGIIEAIENPQLDCYIGVQWHPELLIKEDENSQKIFKYLIDRAKKRGR